MKTPYSYTTPIEPDYCSYFDLTNEEKDKAIAAYMQEWECTEEEALKELKDREFTEDGELVC